MYRYVVVAETDEVGVAVALAAAAVEAQVFDTVVFEIQAPDGTVNE